MHTHFVEIVVGEKKLRLTAPGEVMDVDFEQLATLVPEQDPDGMTRFTLAIGCETCDKENRADIVIDMLPPEKILEDGESQKARMVKDAVRSLKSGVMVQLVEAFLATTDIL